MNIWTTEARKQMLTSSPCQRGPEGATIHQTGCLGLSHGWCFLPPSTGVRMECRNCSHPGSHQDHSSARGLCAHAPGSRQVPAAAWMLRPVGDYRELPSHVCPQCPAYPLGVHSRVFCPNLKAECSSVVLWPHCLHEALSHPYPPRGSLGDPPTAPAWAAPSHTCTVVLGPEYMTLHASLGLVSDKVFNILGIAGNSTLRRTSEAIPESSPLRSCATPPLGSWLQL